MAKTKKTTIKQKKKKLSVSQKQKLEQATLLQQQGRLEKALSQYSDVLSKNNTCDEAHYFSALIYAHTGHLDKALYHLNSALKIEPVQLQYLMAYGDLLLKTGHAEEAISIFTKACKC